MCADCIVLCTLLSHYSSTAVQNLSLASRLWQQHTTQEHTLPLQLLKQALEVWQAVSQTGSQTGPVEIAAAFSHATAHATIVTAPLQAGVLSWCADYHFTMLCFCTCSTEESATHRDNTHAFKHLTQLALLRDKFALLQEKQSCRQLLAPG